MSTTRKLRVFNNVSVDGYFVDANGDMSWAHQNTNEEWAAFASENAQGGGELVFGRVTYEMMASYWPSAAAKAAAPRVAEGMNALPKVVFSRTLKRDGLWNNTRLFESDPAKAVAKLKAEPGRDLVVMGSGTLVALLAAAGLVDEYQLVVNPTVLGAGRTLFEGVARTHLRLERSRTFSNGNVVLWYTPKG
jgi:dihydrofolate reductase